MEPLSYHQEISDKIKKIKQEYEGFEPEINLILSFSLSTGIRKLGETCDELLNHWKNKMSNQSISFRSKIYNNQLYVKHLMNHKANQCINSEILKLDSQYKYS